MKKNTIRSRQGGSRPAAVMAGLAGAALLAACGSSHAPAAQATSPGQLTVQQVDAYAQCMRSHGITNFNISPPDTPSENGDVNISFGNYGVVVGVDTGSSQYQSAESACQHLLPHMVPPPLTTADLRRDDRFAACIRAHGIPNFPDPEVRNGHVVPNPFPSGIDVSSPQFQAAVKTCGSTS
jgi:hypothetical protein